MTIRFIMSPKALSYGRAYGRGLPAQGQRRHFGTQIREMDIPLYHGTFLPTIKRLDVAKRPISFHSGMPHGHAQANFVTTDPFAAWQYAESNAEQALKQSSPELADIGIDRKLIRPTILRVRPVAAQDWLKFEPDIHAGSWFNEGPQTRGELWERIEYGSEAPMRIVRPLRVVQAVHDPNELSPQ